MHEPAVDVVRESFVRFSEAERDFRVTEAVLLGRPISREWIAATTALVFGKLLDYLAAGRAYQHVDALFIEEAFFGPERKIASNDGEPPPDDRPRLCC
jgi:hypothetical protein